MKPLVIYGSSSLSGFTKEILDRVMEGRDYTFVDLNTKIFPTMTMNTRIEMMTLSM